MNLSESEINFEFNPNLSLYIPEVNQNVTEDQIKYLFEKYMIGNISKIDIIFNYRHQKQIFIHFNYWYNTNFTNELQKKILDDNSNATLKDVEFQISCHDNNKIILLPNKNPIDQKKSIKALSNTIKELEKKLKKLEEKNEVGGGSKRQRS